MVDDDDELGEFFGPDQFWRILLSICGLLWIAAVLSFITG